MPKSYGTYFEPFIGGAAPLLSIHPSTAVVGDVNPQLINLYCAIRDDSDNFIKLLKELDAGPCTKELYYERRKRYNEKLVHNICDTEAAALTVWINKHCFNGLYRVNSKGEFNVPYNQKKTGSSFDENNVREIHKYLSENNVSISVSDFEKTCSTAKAGDFVYFDSPYAPESETANFVSYTKDGFSLDEHKRLAALYKKLDEKGVYVMLSNNDVPLIRELYSGYNIISLDVHRAINRDASKRSGKEIIVTNY